MLTANGKPAGVIAELSLRDLAHSGRRFETRWRWAHCRRQHSATSTLWEQLMNHDSSAELFYS